MVLVKICGITNIEDALAAVHHGADALGFIFADSPRKIDPDTVKEINRKLPAFVTRVGVFVNSTADEMLEIRNRCGLDVLQLHGDENPDMLSELGTRIIKAIPVVNGQPIEPATWPGITLLLDTRKDGIAGGSGQVFNWDLAEPVARIRPIILAGGLNPGNVELAVKTVRPYAVDVSSGVEIEPGRKDHEKLAEFIKIAKSLV